MKNQRNVVFTVVYKELFKPFLSSLFDTAMKQAMADEIITPEESLLLSQIEVDIRAFEKEVARCIEEEGGIDDALKTDCFKEQLIANVKKLAMQDGQISKDEEAILDRLEKHFQNETLPATE